MLLPVKALVRGLAENNQKAPQLQASWLGVWSTL